MTGRPIVLLVALAFSILLAVPLAAEAQPAGKVPRVGALGGAGGADSPRWAGFRQGLRELGWEEGRNLALEFRFAGGRHERYRELAGELVRLNEMDMRFWLEQAEAETMELGA